MLSEHESHPFKSAETVRTQAKEAEGLIKSTISELNAISDIFRKKISNSGSKRE
jgi:hypothetical protein